MKIWGKITLNLEALIRSKLLAAPSNAMDSEVGMLPVTAIHYPPAKAVEGFEAQLSNQRGTKHSFQ
jgi:hypothetical protein